VAAGTLDPARGARLIFNDRLDAAVAALFMAVVVLVVISSARVWLRVLQGRTPAVSREAPFVETEYAV
jgi:carbon starvation protein